MGQATDTLAQFLCLWSIMNNYEINIQIGKRIIENADYSLQTHAKSSKNSPVILWFQGVIWMS